ncbi:iron-containing alcohol dehydrogenase, partial [Pseudomonas stutzeri]|nr:iron-containing alcohol dehydrogenase [Stutzerimonas stutzeri]
MPLINYITQIQFDFGAVRLLKSECERVGVSRPLIVTDKGVRAAGIIDTVLDALAGGVPVTIYDGTPPNPNEAAVREAVAVYEAGECDGIIPRGGGGPIDPAQGGAACGTPRGAPPRFARIAGGGA